MNIVNSVNRVRSPPPYREKYFFRQKRVYLNTSIIMLIVLTVLIVSIVLIVLRSPRHFRGKIFFAKKRYT